MKRNNPTPEQIQKRAEKIKVKSLAKKKKEVYHGSPPVRIYPVYKLGVDQ